MDNPRSDILAAVVDDESTAEALLAHLRREGIGNGDVDHFSLNQAGQHHGLPLGGDEDADHGAKGGSAGALTGAGVGGAVGAAVGLAAAPFVGPAAIVGGLAAGAYAGSLAGAVGHMGAHATAAPAPVRPPGVMVAVRVTDAFDEAVILEAMRQVGARFVERATGTWTNGRWADFDPVTPPRHPLESTPV
jgi:hypothetical protein